MMSLEMRLGESGIPVEVPESPRIMKKGDRVILYLSDDAHVQGRLLDISVIGVEIYDAQQRTVDPSGTVFGWKPFPSPGQLLIFSHRIMSIQRIAEGAILK